MAWLELPKSGVYKIAFATLIENGNAHSKRRTCVKQKPQEPVLRRISVCLNGASLRFPRGSAFKFPSE